MRLPTLVSALLLSSTLAAAEVGVEVTGRRLDVAGTRTVPLGLFGVHAVDLTAEMIADLGIECSRELHIQPSGSTRQFSGARAGLAMVVDCMGDRNQPPPPLVDAGWAAHLAKLGREYGEAWLAKADSGKRGYVQLWNEPYLNWAERSAGEEKVSTINRRWYDVDKAVEGGPVTVLKTGEVLRHFRWRRLWPVRYQDTVDRKGKPIRERLVGFNIPMPAGAKAGDTFRAPETRYWRKPGAPVEWTVEESWYPVDPTMTDFWSGEQNLDFYRGMFAAWAGALRAANPDVTILAGWDYNYDAGNWSVWRQLYRPLLREFPTLIDGLTEHHYGIAPEKIQAWYEVAASDGWAITGRATTSWNTECQGVLDPEVYGRVTNASGQIKGPAAKLWEARYNAADLIGVVARSVDKGRARAIHRFTSQADFPACGGAWALRLLKPLRGDLLQATSADQRVWTAATRRADGGTALAIYNHHATPVTVALTAAGGAGTVRRVVMTDDVGTLGIAEQPLGADGRIAIEGREPVLVLLPEQPARGEVRRRQFHPAEGALPPVVDGLATVTIAVPEDARRSTRAWLRLTLSTPDGTTPGATATVAGVELAHDGRLPVLDLPVDPATLASGPLAVSVRPAGTTVVAAVSLVVDQDTP